MISDDYVEYVFDLQEIEGENILEIFKHRFGAVVSQLHLNYEMSKLEDIQKDDDEMDEEMPSEKMLGGSPDLSTFPYNKFEGFMDQITQLNGSVSTERSKIFNTLFKYDRRKLSKSILEPKSFIETNTKFLHNIFPNKKKEDDNKEVVVTENEGEIDNDAVEDALLPDTLEANEEVKKKAEQEEPSLTELINIETPEIKEDVEDTEDEANKEHSDKDKKQESIVSKGMTYLTSVFSAPKVEQPKTEELNTEKVKEEDLKVEKPNIEEAKAEEPEEIIKIPEEKDVTERKEGALSSGINYVKSLFLSTENKAEEANKKLEQEKKIEEEKEEEEKQVLNDVAQQKEDVEEIKEGIQHDKIELEQREQFVEEEELSNEEKTEIENEREHIVKEENLLEEETEKLNEIEEKSEEIKQIIEEKKESVAETEKILEEEMHDQNKSEKRSKIIKIRLVIEKKSGLTTLEIIKKGRLTP